MSINHTNKRRSWICFLTVLVCAVFFAAAVQAAPTIKNVTLDKTTFQPGNGVLRVQVDAECQESVKCKVRVLNAAGKTVYLNIAGTGKGPTFVGYWDGKASAGNKAGLTGGTYVSAGTYKVRAVLYYKLDGKIKFVQKELTVQTSEPKTVSTAAKTVSAAAKTTEKTAAKTTTKVKTVREPYTPPVKVSSKILPTVGAKSWDWVVQVTGNKQVDYLAELICQEILKPGMSEYMRCRRIYAWCVMHFTREGGKISASKTKYKFDLKSAEAKKAISAYKKQVKAMIKEKTAVVNTSDSQTPNGVYPGWFNKRLQGLGKQVGNCTEAAAMFECLCRHAGLECDIIENSLASSHPLHHFWNVTRIDGKWYYNDARMENARLYGRTYVRYSMFLRGKVSLAQKESRYGMIKSKYKKLYIKCEPEDYKKTKAK